MEQAASLLVNEARVGVNDIMNQNGGADKGLGDIAQKVGIANVGAGLPSLQGSSQGFTYASNIGSLNVGTQQLFANSTFHYADNLTTIRGRHMIKTGAQLMRRRLDAFRQTRAAVPLDDVKAWVASWGGRRTNCPVLHRERKPS